MTPARNPDFSNGKAPKKVTRKRAGKGKAAAKPSKAPKSPKRKGK